MVIDARNMHFKDLNESIRRSPDASIEIQNCCGQRYIGCGLSGKELQIYGTPGNALGAYLSGANLFVHGNGQDAAGDTMDGGSIYVDGLFGGCRRLCYAGRQHLCSWECGVPGGNPHESL